MTKKTYVVPAARVKPLDQQPLMAASTQAMDVTTPTAAEETSIEVLAKPHRYSSLWDDNE